MQCSHEYMKHWSNSVPPPQYYICQLQKCQTFLSLISYSLIQRQFCWNRTGLDRFRQMKDFIQNGCQKNRNITYVYVKKMTACFSVNRQIKTRGKMLNPLVCLVSGTNKTSSLLYVYENVFIKRERTYSKMTERVSFLFKAILIFAFHSINVTNIQIHSN